MSEYPEHEKLAQVCDKSQVCGEFVDWLEHHDIHLCEPDRTQRHYWPTHEPINKLLAAFFDIDQSAIDAEKEAMLEALREMNT